jgi:FtsP/CotA-like multicopper oxidase with cupredoxin domain
MGVIRNAQTWTLLFFGAIAWAQPHQVCPRPAPGASVRPPAELRSANGSLTVDFAFRSEVDIYGLTRYCYIYGGAVESPTLRVRPGDEIVLRLKNELADPAGAEAKPHEHAGAGCGSSGPMMATSTNLHFHGLNVPPVCHQDEVIRTRIQPGDAAFEYRLRIPDDELPGLYWYHPHPHGFSERQVLGGASGALIVEGMEKSAPEVAGKTERVLVLRDQTIGGLPEEQFSTREEERPYVPSLDLSINYVPILFPLYKPAQLLVRPGQREFWRVLNASADTFFDLQLLYWPDRDTQRAQPIRLVALDGVPVGPEMSSAERTSLLLPPGARAEFLVTMPPEGMFAQFLTRRYDNGIFGNTDSYRVLANIRSFSDSPLQPAAMPAAQSGSAPPFAGLTAIAPARRRALYFSETIPDPQHPKRGATYFLTEGDARPKVFDMSFVKPDITATQGTVEDWVIENRARESHVFHIHQLHFQLLERDGKPVSEAALRDTVELPFWDGKSERYPSIRLRLDFRDPRIVGTFLYHCHILEHEDGGMMGSIAVVPANPAPSDHAGRL